MASSLLNGDPRLFVHSLIKDRHKIPKSSEQLATQAPLVELSPGLPPIHAAVLAEDLSQLRILLADEAANVNWRYRSVTPLHLAACSNNPELVVELLKNPDANVNAQVRRSKLTPLMLAVYFNLENRSPIVRAEIVELLAEDIRCKLDLEDRDKFTALTYAVNTKFLKAVETLISDGRAKQYSTTELMANTFLAIGESHLMGVIHKALSDAQRADLEATFEVRKVYFPTISSPDPEGGDEKDSSAFKDAAGRFLVWPIISLCIAEPTLPTEVPQERRPDVSNELLWAMASMMRAWQPDSSDSDEDTRTRIPVRDVDGNVLGVGTLVRIHSSADHIEKLQSGHGGFNSDMGEMAGQLGVVRRLNQNQGAFIEAFVPSKDITAFKCFNRKLLTAVPEEVANRVYPDQDGKNLSLATVVRVSKDKPKVVKVQAQSGGWKNVMAGHIGRIGTLELFNENGEALVVVNGTAAYYRPEVLQKITEVVCGNGFRAAVGDRVRIIASAAKMEELQTKQFGGWHRDAAQFAGRDVVIKRFHCNSPVFFPIPACVLVVEVINNGSTFPINPLAVIGSK